MQSERLLESAHEVVVLRAMADEHIVGVFLGHRHFSLSRLELEVQLKVVEMKLRTSGAGAHSPVITTLSAHYG